MNGYLGCFYFLAIVTGATLNTGVQMSLQQMGFVSLGYIPTSEIAGSYGISMFSFWRKIHTGGREEGPEVSQMQIQIPAMLPTSCVNLDINLLINKMGQEILQGELLQRFKWGNLWAQQACSVGGKPQKDFCSISISSLVFQVGHVAYPLHTQQISKFTL